MKTRYFALLLVGLALAGCHSKTSFVGKWKGKVDVGDATSKSTPTTGTDKAGEQMGKALAQSMASMMTVELELKSDNTFSMQMMFFPIEGTYAESGGALTLTPTKAMGMSISDLQKNSPDAKKSSQMTKPMTLKESSDGSTLTMEKDAAKADQGSLVFTREPASK